MPTDDERPSVMPSVMPSPIDPNVECVRADTQTPSGELAQPPAPSPSSGDAPRPCPDGYVPRLRRRRDYTLEGKVIVTDKPPQRNPNDPTID